MEVWKRIPGYDGYSVSDCGRVKNRTEAIMKQQLTKDGYLSVALSQNGRQKRFRVHRLVAQAFLENETGAQEVNHRDEVKTNNRADNLEWCTRRYNSLYGTARDRGVAKRQKAVMQIKDGCVIARYESALIAGTATGICSKHIGGCCRGERMTAGGFQWRFA